MPEQKCPFQCGADHIGNDDGVARFACGSSWNPRHDSRYDTEPGPGNQSYSCKLRLELSAAQREIERLRVLIERAEFAIQRAVTLGVQNADWFQDEADAMRRVREPSDAQA